MFWKAFLNKNVPICLKCKHFMKPINYDALPSDILYGRCNKFSNLDVMNKEIYNASSCREDNKKCGLFGKSYSPIKIE